MDAWTRGRTRAIVWTFAACRSRYSHVVADVEQLPEDLSELEPEAVELAARARDKRLAPLFRRWPSLSRPELSELKRLYNERLRLARHLGSAAVRGSRCARGGHSQRRASPER